MKIFERITKRPALLNYYLRRSFYWPDTLPEVLDYWQQHNERSSTAAITGPMTRCANDSAARVSMPRNT